MPTLGFTAGEGGTAAAGLREAVDVCLRSAEGRLQASELRPGVELKVDFLRTLLDHGRADCAADFLAWAERSDVVDGVALAWAFDAKALLLESGSGEPLPLGVSEPLERLANLKVSRTLTQFLGEAEALGEVGRKGFALDWTQHRLEWIDTSLKRMAELFPELERDVQGVTEHFAPLLLLARSHAAYLERRRMSDFLHPADLSGEALSALAAKARSGTLSFSELHAAAGDFGSDIVDAVLLPERDPPTYQRLTDRGNGYQPSHPGDVAQALEHLGVGEHDVVFDLGSGQGQTVAMFAMAGAGEVRGVEYEPAYAEYSREVTRPWQDRVEITCADVTTVDLSEGTVFYLFNPFGGAVLDSVLEELQALAKSKPIRVFYASAPGRLQSYFPEGTWLQAPGGGGRNFLFDNRPEAAAAQASAR